MPEWDSIAPYYDLLFKDRTFDIPFWVKMAKQFGSPIMELACGTGRLTIPIAKAGIHTYGMDISKSMLGVFRKKIKQLPGGAQQHIHLMYGDVTDFKSPRIKFQAIFSPWGFIPVTLQEQENLFTSVKNALVPNGFIVIDIENSADPSQDWETLRLKELIKIPVRGITLLRQAYTTGNAKTKIARTIFTLDILKRNGVVRKLITERTHRLYTVRDLTVLLVTHGFRIRKIYGDYDFSPWSPRTKQAIVVAQLTRNTFWSYVVNRFIFLCFNLR